MPTEIGRAASSCPPQAARIAVIAALAVERAGLGSRAGQVTFHQSGPGAARAAAAARAALAAGADALVAWGLAGGLVAALAPGDVVLPERVVVESGTGWAAHASWHAALAARLPALFPVHTGALLSAARVVASPEAKRAAASASGAVAVDMESAAVAAVAAEARVPFVAVRVIADASEDALPPRVADWIDAAGERRVLPLFGAALAPGQWPVLLTLARRYRAARRTLEPLASDLQSGGFYLPQAAPGGAG